MRCLNLLLCRTILKILQSPSTTKSNLGKLESEAILEMLGIEKDDRHVSIDFF